jgi:hypothetical protein
MGTALSMGTEGRAERLGTVEEHVEHDLIGRGLVSRRSQTLPGFIP